MFISHSHFFGTVSKFPEQFFAFFLDWIFYYYFLFSLCSSWPSFDRTSPKLSRSSACCCRCRRTIWVRKIWKKCPSSLDLLYHSTVCSFLHKFNGLSILHFVICIGIIHCTVTVFDRFFLFSEVTLNWLINAFFYSDFEKHYLKYLKFNFQILCWNCCVI